MRVRQMCGAASVVATVGAALLVACGTSKGSGFGSSGSGGASGSSGAGGSSGSFNTSPPDDGGPVVHPPTIGWLHGKVVAPEGTVPISNAIVYLTNDPPPAIPSGVYCDTCIHLTPDQPYAYSKPDGTFELAAYAAGKQYLVVQKGQFRRVRALDVTSGDQNVAPDMTRLPGKNDAANGDTIPRIGMVVGGYDHIDATLTKLGVQEFYHYGDPPQGLPGGAQGGTNTGKSVNQLIGSTSELASYHIVLLPCASFGYEEQSSVFTCNAPMPSQSQALNVYVQSGGKLYVTDFSYEAVRQTWPGFITFYDATDNPLTGTTQGVGTGCRGGAEDTPGTPQDKGLGDWMNAIGESNITLQASWSRIASVQAQPGTDPHGAPTTITPKVWMTSTLDDGTKLPATVSFEQQCGRVLFSTYHCEGDSSAGTLLAQEKALLYVLLEVGVCVGQLPPPPPPR